MSSKKFAPLALILYLGVSAVYASEHHNRLYLGLDLQSNKLQEEKIFKKSLSFKGSLSGLSYFAGYRWTNLGTEFGFTRIRTVEYVDNTPILGLPITLVTQKNHNFYLDGIYYHAITNKIDLKALLGVGYLHTQFKGMININPNGSVTAGAGNTKNSEFGPRIGLGMQWAFSKNFSTGLMYKYQLGNKFFKSMRTIAFNFMAHF